MKRIQFTNLPNKVKQKLQYQNAITPSNQKYYKINDDSYIETSETNDLFYRIFNEALFGCTFVNADGKDPNKYSEVFDSEKERDDYINELIKDLN